MKLNEFAADVHALAVEKGWWEPAPSFPEVIALCHCELSEALQEYRDGKPDFYYSCIAASESGIACGGPETVNCYNFKNAENAADCTYKGRKPEGVAVELADVILRILDYCGAAGIDIESTLETKHEYNKGREYRHGGKLI